MEGNILFNYLFVLLASSWKHFLVSTLGVLVSTVGQDLGCGHEAGSVLAPGEAQLARLLPAEAGHVPAEDGGVEVVGARGHVVVVTTCSKWAPWATFYLPPILRS